MKKILAIILALATVLGLCACGAGGAGGNSGSSGGDKTADGKVKLSIGLPTNALVLDYKKNALTKWIEEECGVDLTIIEYAGGTDLATQITTTVAARQELPDILFGIGLNENTHFRYGQDGYFVDLTKYYEDKDGASKTFWTRMENELSEEMQEFVLKTITDPETGSIYCVPNVETSLIDTMNTQAWINQKWLDKLNLQAPTNTQELIKVLKAFKDKDPNGNGVADEIPLFGTDGGTGSHITAWLANMFTFYDPASPYNVGKDGKLYPVYTSDEYREALKFMKQLYDDGLMTSMAWTSSNQEMKQIVTSSSGTAMAGIFLGHLTLCTAEDSEILYEYVPLKPFWNVIREKDTCSLTTVITEDCDDPDKAFEVLMKLWSWEGATRVRYGEYGVNWTDADPGAKSDLGLDATYKLIRDPHMVQHTANWGKISSTLNAYAEGETAQVAENMSPWQKARSAMHAESYRLFNEREAAQDNSFRLPSLGVSVEEKERISQYTANTGSRRSRAMAEFVTGVMNVNSDADWNAYLKEMEDLGVQHILDVYQNAYDRR